MCSILPNYSGKGTLSVWLKRHLGFIPGNAQRNSINENV